MQNYFKVYEVLDNVLEQQDTYPTYFVGAFLDKKMAEGLCKCIDIADCNSTKILYSVITPKDVQDLKKYGLKAADSSALSEIKKLIHNENVR